MRKPEPRGFERKRVTGIDRDTSVPTGQINDLRKGERRISNATRKSNRVPDNLRGSSDGQDDSENLYRPDPVCDDFAM